jgi:hypothetical protein
MFLRRIRGWWSGDRPASLALVRKIVEAGAPVVRQLQITGYGPISACYVFDNFLIKPKGNCIKPNKHGFFEIEFKNYLRPAGHKTINPARGKSAKEIWVLIFRTWGSRGAAAVAWIVGSWFVNQVKLAIGFFPFLSFFNDPATGKSFLTRILNTCQALNEEGLPMSQVNTAKGEIRKLAQRSGLFKALLEANNAEKTRFNFESILPLYNSNSLQVSALKSNDNRTKDLPFLAALLFVQNTEPFRTRAQRERVISLKFNKEDVTPETGQAFKELMAVPIEQFAHFFVEVMAFRQTIEANWQEGFAQAKTDLWEAIPDNRLCDNHALVLAFHRLLCQIIGVDYNLQPYIEKIGRQKFIDCSSRREDVSDHFFDILLNLDEPKEESTPTISNCLEIKDNDLFINVPESLKLIGRLGYKFNVQLKDLHDSLQVKIYNEN